MSRWFLMLFLVPVSAFAEPPPLQKVRYTRPGPSGPVTECSFTTSHLDGSRKITSNTERGATTMVVEASYDAGDLLTMASATLTAGGKATKAVVTVASGRATVRREGKEPQEFDAPKGVIVTSAPDWSDIFLLCRRYERKIGGKQEFPALWIHPTQPAMRLTFTAERRGVDTIEQDGARVELQQYEIVIRNNSRYAAWADADGSLVRLLPLPAQASQPGLTRAGYETAAAALRPAP